MRKDNLTQNEYAAIHYWLKSRYGVAVKCENENCEGRSTKYNWAKIHDKEYIRDRNSFIQLCVSCHRKYDATEDTRRKKRETNRNTNKTHCKRGHLFDKQNTYVFFGKRGWRRMCKKCKVEYNRMQRRRKKVIKIITQEK